MTDEPRKVMMKDERSGNSLGMFLAVALILAAVVGGALLMNQDVSDQASVTTSSDSATGASSGEAGSSATPAPETPSPAPAAPETKPETPPATQP